MHGEADDVVEVHTLEEKLGLVRVRIMLMVTVMAMVMAMVMVVISL